MQSVAALNYALKLRSEWDTAPPIALYVSGKQILEGNLNAFTNPVIESGIIHCRALLEFLGVCAKNGNLATIGKRRRDDIGIEHFGSGNLKLSKIDIEAALLKYDGGIDEAEKALLAVFDISNKGIAHFVDCLEAHSESRDLIEIASRGVPALVVSYLYTPLGLPAPDYNIKSRRMD